MPSFFILDCSVERFIPSRAAAPFGPPTIQLVLRRTVMMYSRSASTSVTDAALYYRLDVFPLDVRVVAATHRDLAAMVADDRPARDFFPPEGAASRRAACDVAH
jgi:hypothetical protein